jgi:hypothetical protein
MPMAVAEAGQRGRVQPWVRGSLRLHIYRNKATHASPTRDENGPNAAVRSESFRHGRMDP